MSRLFALVAIALSSSLPAAPVPKEVRKDTKFEGTWLIESVVIYGEALDLATKQYWTLDADGHMKTHDDPDMPGSGPSIVQMVIDTAAKSIDYKYSNGNNSVHPAVYIMAGDTLKICSNMKGTGIRPAAVVAGPDVYVYTLQRVKR